MEKRKSQRATVMLRLLFIAVIVFVDVEAGNSDLPSPQQENAQPELQSHRLSPSEQAQILSDVRQHESRFTLARQPQSSALENTTPFPSLLKYKVDRAKQQQQLLQQQAILEQREKANQQQQQQVGQSFFQTAQTQYQPQSIKQQQQQQQKQQKQQQQQQQQQQFQAALQSQQEQFNQFQRFPGGNKFQNLNTQLLNDDQNIQLQSYFEKQRQLEILQRQRERLLAEQQELRRQQEFLRLQQLHQLTTTTTTPVPPLQTTFSPLLLSSPSAREITPAESDLFLKAIANHQKKFSTSSTPPAPATTITTTTSPRTNTVVNKQEIPKDILSLIEAQESQNSPSLSNNAKSKPQIQIIYQTEKPQGATSRQKSSSKTKSSQTSAQREALLKQLKLALLQSPDDDVAKNLSTRDIILPNGKTVQVIQAPNSLPSESLKDVVKESLPTTSIRPPNAILEELTKGVLPPGADFEVLRHKVDGNLEEVGKGPLENSPAKKVTFVVLEEQEDGSYKVQGVKGNTDKENGGDVESIVERIKNGELKLPPPSIKPSPTSSSRSEARDSTPALPTNLKTYASSAVTTNAAFTSARNTVATTFRPRGTPENARSIDFGKSNSNDYFSSVTVSSAGESAATDRYVSSATTPASHVFNSFASTARPTVRYTQSYASASSKYPSSARSHFIPTMAPVNEIVTQYQTSTTTSLPTTTYTDYSSTAGLLSPTSYSHFGSRTSATPTSRSIQSNTPKGNVVYEENFERSTPFAPSSNSVTVTPSSSVVTAGDNLIQILKRQGLYAMAKFLGQSGLDTILNDTGPYTIFAPTDKAFRTLLVQLGGPEKAEQKFRESPRLLSGLLLHHVIPGAFRIDSLQDEMTGVSLAGTQLRVNVYSMQDVEWNDVRVTTINGARVLPDKQDVEISQGIAHAVDRVMFPLPVGDLVQTLQADRERRFTVFLRALHASGLEETLSGSKTFTIFAPTDTAFMIASASPNGSPPWLDDEDNQEAAKTLVSRHVIPSTLYSAGMRYYQQKETLHPQASLHIHKSSGRIKVNNAQVITHNIPATNGVIHAIDTLL